MLIQRKALLILTDENFEQEVLKSEIPVLVDFYADWCGPCQMYGPIIEEVAKEWEGPASAKASAGKGGKVKIGKLNVDQAPQTAQKYGVMSIPATLFFDKGQVMQQLAGVQTKETLIDEIKKLVIK